MPTFRHVVAAVFLSFACLVAGMAPLGAQPHAPVRLRPDMLITTKIDARVPTGIPRDCSVDVTEQLQDWLDAQPDGTATDPRVLHLGNGCYGLGSTTPGTRGAAGNLGPRNGLLLIERKHLELRGSPQFRAIIDAPVGSDGNHINRAQLWIENSEGIVVGGVDANRDGLMGSNERLRLQGTNRSGTYDPRAGREHDHGIRVMGGRDIVIKYIASQRTWGDNAYVGPGPDNTGNGPVPWGPDGDGAVVPRAVEIRNSVLQSAGRHSVACVGCVDLTIRQNTMTGAGYWMIDLEQQLPAVPIRGVSISRNTASGARYGFIALTAASRTADGVSAVAVTGNTFSRSRTCYEFVAVNGAVGPDGAATVRDVKIIDNRMRMNQYAIAARFVDGLVASGNSGYTRTTLKCAASDSTAVGGKLFAFLAIKDGVSRVSVVKNSYLRLATDSPDIETAAATETVGTTIPPTELTICSNRTTSSTANAFDQPLACAT